MFEPLPALSEAGRPLRCSIRGAKRSCMRALAVRSKVFTFDQQGSIGYKSGE
jgi:hypothetical protein